MTDRETLIEVLSRAADSIKPEPGMDGPHGGYLGGITRQKAAAAIESAIDYLAAGVRLGDEGLRAAVQAWLAEYDSDDGASFAAIDRVRAALTEGDSR